MLTQPGCLPIDIQKVRYDMLPEHMRSLIEQIGIRMKKLEVIIRLEGKSQKKKDKNLQIIDPKKIQAFSVDAEISSENEYDGEDDGDYYMDELKL